MTESSNNRRRDWRDLFAVPPIIKQVFAQFPLSTYPANALPTRSPTHRDQHTLYTWTTTTTTTTTAKNTTPSFNPTCLKWQTYLLINGIPFRTQPSTNHASPSGSLPFLLPATSTSPIPSPKLESWVFSQSGSAANTTTTTSARQEIYTSLIDHAIRRAWLYLLYLHPENFSHVAKRLYITPSSSSSFVAMALSYQLRDAATQELAKTTPETKAEDLLSAAVDAFKALSTLLGEAEWFFGKEVPGLFDASVFAYVHLLLDEEVMEWRFNPLKERLLGFGNLVAHRDRILKEYYC